VSVPGYLAKESELKAMGVDKVVVLAVNDAAVMTAWAKDQGVVGSIINFVADSRAEATMALGLAIEEPPDKFGFYPRTKRFAMIVKDGVVKKLNVCETPDDATGDSVPEMSFAEQMLKDLKGV
jgi:cytochrome c peroxidase